MIDDSDENTPVRPRRSPFESDERRDRTSPIAMLERELEPDDLELAERLQQVEPATLVARLARVFERIIDRERRRKDHDSAELSNQVAVAIDEQRKVSEWLRDNVKSLLSSRSIATKVIGFFAGCVSAVLVVVVKILLADAEADGVERSEMQHMQKAQEKQSQIQEKQGAQIEEILRLIYRRDTP